MTSDLAINRLAGALILCLLTTPALADDAAATDTPAASEEQVHFFERNVRPLLLENCTSCHGVEQQEAELRLDSRAAMLEGGDRGPAIVPGNAEESLLILAVRHDEDEDLAMPVGIERPAVAVEISLELDRRDRKALVLEDLGERAGEDALA